MKFKNLLLGAAASFAVIGGAQAADLAVAAPGGMCADGSIPVAAWCLKISAYVRQDLAISPGPWSLKTKFGTTLLATTSTDIGDVEGKIAFVGDSSTPGVVFDGGHGRVNIFWFGWEDNAYDLGASTTDNGLDGPDFGKQDYVRIAPGPFWIQIAENTDLLATTTPMITAGFSTSLGGVALAASVGFVDNLPGTGIGVMVRGSAPMGAATLVAQFAYGSGWEGFADGGSGAYGNAWSALIAASLPLGGIFSLDAGFSYADHNGTGDWQAAVRLQEVFNSAFKMWQEWRYNNATSSSSVYARWGVYIN